LKKFIFCLAAVIASTLSYSQSTASNNVSTFLLNAPQLDSVKKIWVYLPKTYHNNDENFPVLYLHDAQNLFDKSTSYAEEWQVDETLDSLELNLVVIGIEHGNEKRIDELTPFPHEKYKGGKADEYLKFITETLMPEINERYRVNNKCSQTFIGGSSLGGLVSYYAILKYPKLFGKAMVFSPSFWYSDEIYNFTNTIEIDKISEAKFYLRAGEKEDESMVPDMFRMKEQLIEKGLSDKNINIGSIPEGHHNEALWRDLFPQAAQWLLED
jgi:predicted alpha/beta superfamily hydrolase